MEEEDEEIAPFLIPDMPLKHEQCKILHQFQLVAQRLPKEVQAFLWRSFADPFFVQFRQNSNDSMNIPRSRNLILLYQCIRRCPHEEIPYAICAISIITGLSPQVILEHTRLHIEQSKLSIIESIHKKATMVDTQPIYSFSGRIEVTKRTEIIPITLLWTLPTNSLSSQNLLPLKETKSLFVPSADHLEINETLQNFTLPKDLTPQQKYYLLNPSIRRELQLPFFFSKDLSEGFNPAHGLPPVPCFNEFDNEKPPQIRWIAESEIPESIPQEYKGCKCLDCDCCKCHVISFENNIRTMCYNKDGRINLDELNECRPLIIECNPECCCDPLYCKNRVVLNKPRIQLMITRSKSKSGWGVKTMEFIPKGSFVCEYVGTVISDPKVAEMRGLQCDQEHESYLFDLDAYEIPDGKMLTVDSLTEGNVAKYINHTCVPNLVAISVAHMKSHYYHRIGFFAARDIYPKEELGFHYNYALDVDPERFIQCNCGSLTCRTRLR